MLLLTHKWPERLEGPPFLPLCSCDTRGPEPASARPSLELLPDWLLPSLAQGEGVRAP